MGGGGNGIDVLTGGAGADTFHFLSSGGIGMTALHKTITDFAVGTDKIEFGFMHFADFLDELGFSHTPGEIRYVAATGCCRAMSTATARPTGSCNCRTTWP